MEEWEYVKLFKEICKGSSPIKTSFGSFFLKHINVFDQSEIEQQRLNFIEQAKKNGLPTAKEALSSLYEEGFWTEKEEALISQEQVFIEKLQHQKKNCYLKSQIDSFNLQISDALKRLNELKNKRQSFLGNTCENFADQRITEELIKSSLHNDELCTKKSFSDGEFDEVSINDLMQFVDKFNGVVRFFTDLNIQKMILQDFFAYYMPHCEETYQFFGKPIVELTFNQLKVLLYARYFKNVLSSCEDIPEQYRRDPEKIIEFVGANEKAKKVLSKTEKEGSAQSIVGATSEDYKYLNLKKGNVKSLSLAEEARKKGGSLDMKDLMGLLGS